MTSSAASIASGGYRQAVPLLARRSSEKVFLALALISMLFALLVLLTLVGVILLDGLPRLNWDFLISFPSRNAERAGIYSALAGSAYLMVLTGLIAVPLGVGAAIYLEEYARRNRFTRLIELNIANLAGVPSIIYGLLGLQLFVRVLGLERSVLAGALTLSTLVLPIVIMSGREALRRVPRTIREASYALGATKWQTVWCQVLPSAFPGILTGCILAFSRAIGETAPLVTMGALTYIAFLPDSPLSPFTALPIQAFNWISRPQPAFHANAAAAIIVLLVILLCCNAAAIFLRQRLEKRLE
ncbi:MAG: phosphate ABC transporter permease PtsA [Proteobacteria bacterium]|nr:MAG: phosphate ABC transporter permease PtsA [Pseudomonadota bacterium]